MTCIPGNIQVAHTEEVYLNPTVKCHQVECNICDASLAMESLKNHLKTQHNLYWSFVLNWESTFEHEAVVYQATANATGTYFWPVPACVGIADSEAVL